MIIVSILALVVVALLIIGGIRLNMCLRQQGSLPSLQNGKNEVKGAITERDDADKIRREIKSDITVQAKFEDMFGPYVKVEATKGYPVWVTVWTATYDKDQLRYSKYIKRFDNYEAWQTSDLYAGAFVCVAGDAIPQLVKGELDKMVQESEAEAHARAKQRHWRLRW